MVMSILSRRNIGTGRMVTCSIVGSAGTSVMIGRRMVVMWVMMIVVGPRMCRGFLHTHCSCIMRGRSDCAVTAIAIATELISVERERGVTCRTIHPRKSRWGSVLTFCFFLQVYIECTVKTDNMAARLGRNRHTRRAVWIHFDIFAVKHIATKCATVIMALLLRRMMRMNVHTRMRPPCSQRSNSTL